MGAGIAIVAARSGFETVAYDLTVDALEQARASHERVERLEAERGLDPRRQARADCGRHRHRR